MTPPHGEIIASLPPAPVSFATAFWYWFRLGFISFGGPAGQIAIMHTELVEQKRWISEKRFLHALNYCMLLPGPEAQQLAIYIGWLMHRTWGGIVAVLDQALILLGQEMSLHLRYCIHGDAHDDQQRRAAESRPRGDPRRAE